MIAISCFAAAVLFSPLVRSAPTMSLDADTLLQNGQDAQQLNAVFANLTTADPCSTGEVACISGGLAQCVNNQWQTQKCLKGLQCFALPSVRGNGTIVECTSKRTASSAIAASGAKGGLVSNTTSTDVPFPTSDDDDDCSSSIVSSSSKATSTSVTSITTAQPTVTVTITLGPTPTTLPAETRTLSPDDASSLLSSLIAGGAFSVVSTIFGTAEPSAVVTPLSSAQSSGSAMPTTIQLTKRPSTRSVTTLAAAAATSSVAVAGGASGYGY